MIFIFVFSADWSQPQEGPCSPIVCGPEAACSFLGKNSHLCICAHDGSPPNSDRKCPNRITGIFCMIRKTLRKNRMAPTWV